MDVTWLGESLWKERGSREGVTSVARFRSGGCEEFSSSRSSFAPSFAGPLRTPRLPDVSACSAPLPGFGYAACTFLWPERVLASPVLLLLSSCATSPLSLPSTSLDLSPVSQLHRLPLSTPPAPLSPLVLNARAQSPPPFPLFSDIEVALSSSKRCYEWLVSSSPCSLRLERSLRRSARGRSTAGIRA